MKFHGRYEDLQDLVLVTGAFGEWVDRGPQKQFRAQNGAVMNWWPKTGTLNFQGKYPGSEHLLERVRAEIERRHASQEAQRMPAARAPAARDPEVPF